MPAENDELSLSTLKPAQKRRPRKRIGRGMGSGKGRYSGRGIKGQKSRAGSHKMRPGFEGGQMPIYMRLGKQPGSTSKDAMPIGPFRTRTAAVNVSELERVFDAGDDVTIEALAEKRLIRNTRTDVKILGTGQLTKKLTVTVHLFSRSAAEKIEAAGGTANALRPPRDETPKKRRRKTRETDAEDAARTEAGAEETDREPDESVDAQPEGAAEAAEGEA